MADESSENETSGQSSGGFPMATAIGALVVGAVVGGALGWTAKPTETKEVEVPRELTAAEMAEACGPELEETTSELEEAQNKVAFLEKEVVDRDVRVKELEAKLKSEGSKPSSSSGGSDLARKLARARADLEEAREELTIALSEKERLVAELTATKEELSETKVELVDQKKKTKRAKEDALVNKWYRFINGAQLDICEKGNRKRLGRCREAVQLALQVPDRRDKFAHCVRSGQAVPTVRELEKNEALPDFAEMVDEEQKQARDWYILLCDPTLPERDGFLNEEHLPPTAVDARPG